VGLCEWIWLCMDTEGCGLVDWLRIELAGGCGSEGITSGFPMNHGAGCRITMEGGLSCPLWVVLAPSGSWRCLLGTRFRSVGPDSTYVAWVPLGPREIYYGHGHYGPYSVNITNVNVTNIQVNRTVYKNIYVHNAVTVVHHDTFVKGKRVDVKVKQNPFLRRKSM